MDASLRISNEVVGPWILDLQIKKGFDNKRLKTRDTRGDEKHLIQFWAFKKNMNLTDKE